MVLGDGINNDNGSFQQLRRVEKKQLRLSSHTDYRQNETLAGCFVFL